MRVGRSAYYAYRRGETFRDSFRKAECVARIKECFAANRRRYGSRRIAAQLKLGRFGVRVSVVMRRENLRAIAPKLFVPQTTDSKHSLAVNPNLLENPSNQPSGRGEVFVGDIYLSSFAGRRFLLPGLSSG